jgi:hypothetical protein
VLSHLDFLTIPGFSLTKQSVVDRGLKIIQSSPSHENEFVGFAVFIRCPVLLREFYSRYHLTIIDSHPHLQPSVIFLYGSYAPHSAWLIIGIGVCFAQDAGAHRRKPEGHKHTVQIELWKRAFWSAFMRDSFVLGIHRVLITVDRHMSAALGRPCAVHEEE